MVVIVAGASAQGVPPPAEALAPNATDVTQQSDDVSAAWTESLGEPTLYVERARAEVGLQHYKSAARSLRKAADVLAGRSKNAYGLDLRRLSQDIEALRLTARDVAAGAVTSPAQLDSVLNTTHTHLQYGGRTHPQA